MASSSIRTVSSTMRAWSFSKPGSPLSVLTLGSLPTPAITTPTGVLVRVQAASLNPGPAVLMHTIPFLFRSAAPAVPDLDFAGTVVAVGEGVPAERKDGLVEGKKVFGSIPVPAHLKTGGGALAEYAVVDADNVLPLPRKATLQDAAGLGVAGGTALACFDAAHLKKGQKVLVNGASGGVGSYMVQLAKHAVGETGVVVGVCSGKNAEFVKALGADEVVDYTIHPSLTGFLTSTHGLSRFDSVIDCRGVQALYNDSAALLAQGKSFITVGPQLPAYSFGGLFSAILLMLKNFARSAAPTFLGGVGRKYAQVTASVDKETLQRLSKLVDEGVLRTPVVSRYSMEDALKAYELLLRGRAVGKLIVDVKSA